MHPIFKHGALLLPGSRESVLHFAGHAFQSLAMDMPPAVALVVTKGQLASPLPLTLFQTCTLPFEFWPLPIPAHLQAPPRNGRRSLSSRVGVHLHNVSRLITSIACSRRLYLSLATRHCHIDKSSGVCYSLLRAALRRLLLLLRFDLDGRKGQTMFDDEMVIVDGRIMA